jgi:CheY-like chemotaxis protein
MTTFVENQLPTLVLISKSEIHSIFLRHKLFHKYHIHTISSDSPKVEDLLGLKTDVILIDDEMLFGDIFNFCSNIKKKRDLQFVPILIISGNLKKSYLEKIKKAGALDILIEPLDEAELLLKLSHAIKYQQRHTKINIVAKNAQEIPREKSSHQRAVFNKTDALRIQKEIIEKKPVTLIIIETAPFGKIEIERKVHVILSAKLGPKDLFIPLSEGKAMIILSNIASKKGEIFAKDLASEISKLSSLSFFISVVSQDPEGDILFPSLEEMIRVARQCLTQAKSSNKKLVSYIHQ